MTEFKATLEAHTSGLPRHEKFMQDITAAFSNYKREIWATAPRFTPFTSAEIAVKYRWKDEEDDLVGEIAEIQEPMGPGGKNGKIMNLDDVREHIKK